MPSHILAKACQLVRHTPQESVQVAQNSNAKRVAAVII
ncbi:uncharacterized protein FFC1_07129 [Fusarium fujikuroi]|nr:uncharacterized protein FFC1_07129 [Fusarium fujikuroi]